DGSEPCQLDPAGEEPLRLAKQVRRGALRRGGTVRAAEEAVRTFGMPPSRLGYAAGLPRPLYPPERSSSN
ncbi:MAG TPA: hypothetical protein VFX39_02385, partial [Gemmatimonadaceae bacterium]|nr:hypothetical protein [Gemmatimonadaceae bacterium]